MAYPRFILSNPLKTWAFCSLHSLNKPSEVGNCRQFQISNLPRDLPSTIRALIDMWWKNNKEEKINQWWNSVFELPHWRGKQNGGSVPHFQMIQTLPTNNSYKCKIFHL